jgi:hypothetical protein
LIPTVPGRLIPDARYGFGEVRVAVLTLLTLTRLPA